MRICFCSLAFRDEPIEAILPRLAALGYDAVEIWGRHIDGRSDGQLAALREQARSLGLGIEVLSPYFWLTQTDALREESLRIAERFVHYAHLLGCPKIRTFTDAGPTGIGSEAATPAQWAAAVAALQRITAMDPAVSFVVETHVKTLADTPESTLRLLADVAAPNLKVLYQPTAASPPDDYERLRPHIVHLHLQNETPTGGNAWLEEGCMDVGRLMRRLAADGYVGSLSVEYCWRDIPWERAATARTFLAACLAAKEALA